MLASTGNQQLVRGDVLKSVFEEIDIIGIACKQLLIDLLELEGIVFDDNNWYLSSEIEKALLKTFGEDATPLLMKRIELGIELQQRLDWNKKFAQPK